MKKYQAVHIDPDFGFAFVSQKFDTREECHEDAKKLFYGDDYKIYVINDPD